MTTQDKLKELAMAFREEGGSYEYPGFVMISNGEGFYQVGDANGKFEIDYTYNDAIGYPEPVTYQPDPRGPEIPVSLPLEAEAWELVEWVSVILTQRS
jgi:hypothetical protein